MFAKERRADIVKRLEQQQTVTVSELMQCYQVSIETIRRDLEQMEKLGLLKRVHGGAISLHRMTQFAELDVRVNQNVEQKRQVAHAVIRQLQEGDCIALDAGSTAREIALLLREQFHHLTVVTYSPEIFAILAPQEGFHLIQIGGEYLRSERAFYGHQAQEMLLELHVQKSILCPAAFSSVNGLMDQVPELVPMQRGLLQIAKEMIVAADSSKLESTAAYQVAAIRPGLILATDCEVAAGLQKSLLEKGISIIVGR